MGYVPRLGQKFVGSGSGRKSYKAEGASCCSAPDKSVIESFRSVVLKGIELVCQSVVSSISRSPPRPQQDDHGHHSQPAHTIHPRPKNKGQLPSLNDAQSSFTKRWDRSHIPMASSCRTSSRRRPRRPNQTECTRPQS